MKAQKLAPTILSFILTLSCMIVADQTLLMQQVQAQATEPQAQAEATPVAPEAIEAEQSPQSSFAELDNYIKGQQITPEAEALVNEMFTLDPSNVEHAMARTQEKFPNKGDRIDLSDPEIESVFRQILKEEVQTAKPSQQLSPKWPFAPNKKELALCAATGLAICSVAARAAVIGWAHAVDNSHGNRTYGCGDAFRHAYWNGIMAYNLRSTIAKWYGDAHEWGQDPNSLDTRMDLHNNSVGRYHGSHVWLITSVHNAVHESLDDQNGRPLWYIDTGRDGKKYIYPTSPYCHP
jgi:hypothetical protein